MNTSNSYRPKLLKTLMFDISDYAAFVEMDLEHLLRKPVKGIYCNLTGRLLINSRESGYDTGESNYYYHDSNNKQFVSVNQVINCVKDIKAPVYDSSLNIVVTSSMLSDPLLFLTDKPSKPIAGLQAVEIFVTNYIFKNLRWKKLVPDVWFELAPLMEHTWSDPYRQVSDCEKAARGQYASSVQEETNRHMTNALTPLLEQIDIALGGDNQEWAIVNVKRSVTKLRIQVYEDYRISEWMNEHDQGRNMANLQPCCTEFGDDVTRLWRF